MSSVLSALKVLEELAARQPAGVSDLARSLSLPKTTVHRALSSLRDSGWIEPAPGQQVVWRLSLHAFAVGSRAATALGGLRSVALPVMDEMRNATEENIHLFARHGDDAVLIERIDGVRPSRTFYALGTRSPLHELSTGKAMLAFAPSPEAEAYLQRVVESSNFGPDDADKLRQELEEIRLNGFAVRTRSVWADGDRAIAAPILGRHGHAIAAMSVSAPAQRLTPKISASLGPKIVDAARRVTLGLALS